MVDEFDTGEELYSQHHNLDQERDRLTREALADVDDGAVVDHDAVEAWAKGLNRGTNRSPTKKPQACTWGFLI
jgi:hypothetical protein